MLHIVTSFLLLDNDLLDSLTLLVEVLSLLYWCDSGRHNMSYPKYGMLQTHFYQNP